ncbi:uncharacterized protein C8Q71DRAFT_852170 [Rhodofomes roseus]|uniref:Cyclin N-terminal domain-containing protein n=1 Tax=Rhodofomes roseus TaxID=34475 RepID=A0ABQ8KWQ8_9APHY|nr:uncharacterized protein C8Q71DRAFT_852170 [Rhodofomes roseus]KAH9843646.1 hypothetical protein C8Q71DRAFT_852170 [Rhodofomes roseus]
MPLPTDVSAQYPRRSRWTHELPATSEHANLSGRGQATNDYPVTHVSDPLEAWRPLATICVRFMHANLRCVDPALEHRCTLPPLPDFIAFALYRSHSLECVVFATLMLMHRIEVRNAGRPHTQLFVPQHLFLAVFMVAWQVINDNSYKAKDWTVVGRNIPLKDLTKAVRDVCVDLLDWNLQVNPDLLASFTTHVKGDYSQDGPYQQYGPEFADGLIHSEPDDEDTAGESSAPAARAAVVCRYREAQQSPQVQGASAPLTTRPPDRARHASVTQNQRRNCSGQSTYCVATPCAW